MRKYRKDNRYIIYNMQVYNTHHPYISPMDDVCIYGGDKLQKNGEAWRCIGFYN